MIVSKLTPAGPADAKRTMAIASSRVSASTAPTGRRILASMIPRTRNESVVVGDAERPLAISAKTTSGTIASTNSAPGV
jgi:hypothetical protein